MSITERTPTDAAFHYAPVAMLLVSATGNLLAANPAACALLGRSEDDIRDQDASGIIAAEYLGSPAGFGHAPRPGHLLHADGHRIAVDLRCVTVPGLADGGTLLLVATEGPTDEPPDDFASRLLVLDSVANATHDLHWAVDPERFGLLWFNRALAEHVRSQTGSELRVGTQPRDLEADPQRLDWWHDTYRQTLASDGLCREHDLRSGDRCLRLTLSVLRHADEVIGIAVHGRDVTDEQTAYRRLAQSEARYRAIFETMAEGVVFQAADGTIVSVNPAAESIQSREPEEMLGRTSDDKQWGAVREDGTEFPGHEHPAMHTLRTGEAQKNVIMGILTPGGHRRWISINSAPVVGDTAPAVIGVVTTFHDITAQRLAEEQLRIAALAFESAQEAMMVTDRHHRILRINGAFTEVTGYSADEAVGRTPGELLRSDRHDDSFFREMHRTLETEHRWEGEIWNRKRNGEVFAERLTITALTDAHGQVDRLVSTFVDLSAAKQAEADIQRLTNYDALTGLPNRRTLVQHVQQAVEESRRSRHSGALLCLDIDRFKLVNDTRGPAAGDALLVAVAERIEAALPSDAFIARLGSDEFAILLEPVAADDEVAADLSTSVALAVQDALGAPFDIGASPLPVSASIGIAIFRDGAPSSDEVLARADAALLSGRDGGIGRIHFFKPELQQQLESRLELLGQMRRAVPDELRLMLQPQVDTRGVVVGAEALLRWEHPVRGLMSPVDFIPLAEETGLIVPLGEWALDTACRLLHEWQADPRTRHLTLAVNVSPRQLREPGFVDAVHRILDERDADPTRLKIELTETMLVDDLDSVAATMRELRRSGVGFSLDDFGTGYSSLRNLKGLPLDQLKIDKSFVQDLGNDAAEAAFVRMIVTLGQTLGLTVIAEGVETPHQRSLLELLGCDWYQGYLFRPPLPPDEFVDFARASQRG